MKYYLVQVDFEYMQDNKGGYTTLKTKAARLRDKDIHGLEWYCYRYGVRALLVPTTYKPVGTTFINPVDWSDHRHKLEQAMW